MGPAPVVLTEPMQLTCPEPKPRSVPAYLLQPLKPAAPAILAKGEGDYGIARADLETMIDALRALSVRLALWKAWAAPEPQGGDPWR